jgi:hypothetical protein
LSAADRQGDIARGDVGESLRHEQGARRTFQRAQEQKIVNPLGAHGESKLRAFFGLRRAHLRFPFLMPSPVYRVANAFS